jgi:hypothetical protein
MVKRTGKERMLHEPPPGYPYGTERGDHSGYQPDDQPASYDGADYLSGPESAEEPAELRRRIEDAAHAANELQSALFDLEAELLRLQHIVRKASPAMMQLMQAATEVNAAGLADQR